MAYSDDITLRDFINGDKVFSRQLSEPNRCSWIDQGTTAQEPRILRISHRKEARKGGVAGQFQDRHTVEILHTKKDATTGELFTVVGVYSLQIPQTGPFTRAMIDDVHAFMWKATNGFLPTTTYVDKLLRSEL